VAFPLPHGVGPLVHEIVMSESDHFAPHSSHRAELPSPDEVEIRLVGQRLRVNLIAVVGGDRRPPAVHLEPGQWLRWHINYRFSGGCCGEWSYRLDTLNFAHGLVDTDTFLGQPHRLVDERRHLR
jgi:hypothetical protein